MINEILRTVAAHGECEVSGHVIDEIFAPDVTNPVLQAENQAAKIRDFCLQNRLDVRWDKRTGNYHFRQIETRNR